MIDRSLNAAQVIELLGLQPHPEGGHYRETYRHTGAESGRGDCTAIFYLLAAGERSAWHRVDAVEIWHWYAGAPLALSIAEDGHDPQDHMLSANLTAGHLPQAVVPPFAWQAAQSEGAWTLAGCTVSPAFSFDGFELAPAGWQPHSPGR
jgi:predicted cupin superfamily sugar epimerase